MTIYTWRHPVTAEFLGLYRENDDLSVDVWDGADSWLPSTITVFELHGVGGSTEYWPVDLPETDLDSTATDITLTAPEDSPIAKSGFAPRLHVIESDQPKDIVFGWASVAFRADGTQVIDHQGHMIDVDDLEDMAYNFALSRGTSGDMHTSAPFGEMIESMVFTPEKIEALGIDPGTIPYAWWVGFKLPPEQAKAVRDGRRRMLSIEGSAHLDHLSD